MIKHIYEHLKTNKKYKKLELKYEIKCQELEHKILELNEQKKINKIEREKFGQAVNELTQKFIKEKLKKERRKYKNE